MWSPLPGSSHVLIEDQHRRGTSAARLAYEQHHEDDGSPFQSPALSDAQLYQAAKEPCDRSKVRPAPARYPRPVWWLSVLDLFGILRCRLSARATRA